jgi:hypothetical protein
MVAPKQSFAYLASTGQSTNMSLDDELGHSTRRTSSDQGDFSGVVT